MPVVRQRGDTELASRLGYRSEAAFARAFKRVIGVPPGAVKRVPEAQIVGTDPYPSSLNAATARGP